MSIFIQPIKKELLTVKILYYRPDFHHIIQEFTWQTEDLLPKMPRIQLFLKYWQDNIEAVISEVIIMENARSNWRRIDHEGILR